MNWWYIILILFTGPILGIKFLHEKDIKDYAVVKVPVADLSTQSLESIYKDKSVNSSYEDMPFAEGKGYFSCARVHQLLFNEVVKVLEYKGPEVKCEIANVFFENNSKIPIKTFWTLKKYIVPLEQLRKENYKINYIPEQYADNNKKILINNNTLTLSWPWYDPITKKTYSAGTRFTRDKIKDKASYYAINLLDFSKCASRTSFVPKKFSVVEYSQKPEIALCRFVKLLKRWANQSTGFIPYVTGGCSFIKTYSKDDYFLKKIKIGDRDIEVWERPNTKAPYSGMDCSCLIARAAQILGMPYFFKNTTTLAKYLRELKIDEKLEDGDLIWYNGHVLIISDIKNNKVIESAGYPFGHGKVHEISLDKLFKDIDSYDQLLESYYHQKPLERLRKDGTIGKKVPRFKIFKTRSIWENS